MQEQNIHFTEVLTDEQLDELYSSSDDEDWWQK